MLPLLIAILIPYCHPPLFFLWPIDLPVYYLQEPMAGVWSIDDDDLYDSVPYLRSTCQSKVSRTLTSSSIHGALGPTNERSLNPNRRKMLVVVVVVVVSHPGLLAYRTIPYHHPSSWASIYLSTWDATDPSHLCRLQFGPRTWSSLVRHVYIANVCNIHTYMNERGMYVMMALGQHTYLINQSI